MNSDDIELGIITPGQGTTPLHIAVWQGKIPTVAALLRDNADINAKDDNGHTPFDYAMKSEHHHTALFLLDHGAQPTRIGDINILLGCAFRLKNFIKIQLLVEKHKGDPNVKDAFDWTLLHWAVYQGEIKLVRCLLNDRRTNVNAVTNKKMTPYDFAQQQLKAALEYPGGEWGTPLFTEERKLNHGKIVELFKKHEAKLGALTVMWAQKKQCPVFSRMPRDVALIIAGMVMRQ